MRLASTVLLALLLVAGLAAEAAAHGGNFRAGDPAPGPPVPGNDPGGGGPTTPPAVPLPSGRARWAWLDWRMWWSLNVEAWDPPHRRLEPAEPVAVTPGDDDEESPSTDDEVRWLSRLLFDRARRRVALPYLKEIVDPDRHEHRTLVAAALIAWARMAEDGDVLPWLRHYALDPEASTEVREAAVLGLGLLRRSAPEERLDDRTLGEVRDLLFRIGDDPRCPLRVRAVAPYALGLLADQPFGDQPLAANGCLVARALALRLGRGLGEDYRVALLVALGMHPREGVPDGVRAELQRLVLKGTAFSSLWTPTERSHALQALARLGPQASLPVLRRVLESPSDETSWILQGAGANALAEIAPALSTAERVSVAAFLLERLPTLDPPSVAGAVYLALGALLRADLDEGSTALVDESKAAAFLLGEVRDGSLALRPYAALALGVATRSDHPASRPAAVFRAEAAEALAWGLLHARGADEVVSAYAAAAGLARVQAAHATLLAILANVNRRPETRAYAARALGALGQRDEKTVATLIAATRERISPFIQTQATHALGLLAAPGACEALLEQLEGDPTEGAMVAVALSLGRIRDPRAADRLVALARNTKAGLNVRAMAIVALGLIFDPEDPASRVRLRACANYFGLTGTHGVVLGIL